MQSAFQESDSASITDLSETESEHTRSFHEDAPILNFFNISLYVDDLIIIGLLLFLFWQENDDISLYLVLILLLFS